MTIDADRQEMETSFMAQQNPLSSQAEVILQITRGLDLLFLEKGGHCATSGEQCCFYVGHPEVVKASMTLERDYKKEEYKQKSLSVSKSVSLTRFLD